MSVVVYSQAAEAASSAQVAEAAQLRQQVAEVSGAAAQAAAQVREREGEVQRLQAERQQEREAAAGAMSRKQAELDAAMRSVHQLREHLLATQGNLQVLLPSSLPPGIHGLSYLQDYQRATARSYQRHS